MSHDLICKARLRRKVLFLKGGEDEGEEKPGKLRFLSLRISVRGNKDKATPAAWQIIESTGEGVVISSDISEKFCLLTMEELRYGA